MLTLIEREFRDHIVYFLAAALFSAGLVGLLFTSAIRNLGQMVGLLIMPVVSISLLGSACLGASQMYADRANKITSFLSTLAIGRGQILVARCLVGLAALLLALVPAGVVAIVLVRDLYPPLLFSRQTIICAGATILLSTLNCYGVGLLTGWATNRFLPAAGCLLFPPVMASLVAVAGFGPGAIGLFAVLLLASMTCVWVKFSSTPL